MTKRACPFDNHLVRQLKVHLNDYENDEKTLKDIQERTVTKLMDGCRRLYSCKPTLTNPENENSNINLIEQCQYDKKFMQKSLINYFPLNGKLRNVKSQIILNMSTPSKCTFCDADVTSPHRCIKCSEFYCSSCTFVMYDSIDDARICLSCS